MKHNVLMLIGALVMAPAVLAATSDSGSGPNATTTETAARSASVTATTGDAGAATGDAAAATTDAAKATAGPGVDLDKLSPIVDNPWVALAARKRAVYA